MNARWLAVARGDLPADLVLRAGRVFSVFTREWLQVDVAICDGHVAGLGRYDGDRVLETTGVYLVPGFIDAHVHIESSKLTPDHFARTVVPRGTTAIVADPHEIGNVLGADGIHWLLDTLDRLPLDVFIMAPSCIPASRFESPVKDLELGAIAGLLRRRRVIGLAEMMNFPGVIGGDEAELAKLETGLTDHVGRLRAGRPGPRPQRLRRRGYRLGPRVDHLRGGSREAPAWDGNHAPRGFKCAQPCRPAASCPRLRP